MSDIALKERSIRISGNITVRAYRAGMIDAVMPFLDKIRTLRKFAQDFPDAHGDYVVRAIATHADRH